MKKILFTLITGILLFSMAIAQTGTQPRKCGMQQLHEAMIAKNPAWAQRLQNQKASLQATADYYMQYNAQSATERTTATISPVPVIFHIIVDSAQFISLGGTAGIITRCDSQIAVLNADFNHQNYDSTLLPTAWKDSLYGNAGIHFGLARRDPSGHCSPGFEVKIIPGTSLTDAGFSNEGSSFPEAKTAGTGLPAWDVTKYYNVWCINYTGSASSLLGITIPLSSTGSCWGCNPVNEEGVCILYNILGSTGRTDAPPAGTGSWYTEFDRGRTLTHETGHFFEIWHPWGDDGGLCPWDGGQDDGLADTPPESDAVYGNPAYTISGGTYHDGCQYNSSTNTQPIGIACLSYMDYTDDIGMHLFTPMQAAAMASMVLVPLSSATGATGSGTVGENYNLTQNPNLLVCPTGVAVSPIEINGSLTIYPNPTTGQVNISLNATAETLNQVIVLNLLGQEVLTLNGQGKDYYSLDLSGMNKGIYILKCNFVSGTITRKISLQ